MKYIGLDIHKKHTHACVRDENGKVQGNERFRTDVADIGRYFQRMTADTDQRLAVALEATGFYFWIYDCIVALGHEVLVVHPTKVKPLMRAKAKNDKHDAATLAELLHTGCLEGIYVPPPPREIREMRDLTRHRESMVRKRSDLKREVLASLDLKGVKLPEEFHTNFTRKQMDWMRSLHDFVIGEKLDLLELTVEKIGKVQALIEERWDGDGEVRLIRTIPGVGLVTAAVLKAEIWDLSRFPSAESLAAYVGLTPTTYQSGEKEWTGPTRRGNSRVKHVLIEAMLFHTHFCPDSRISLYKRRKSDAIGKKKAVVAAGRKLLEAI